VTNQGHARENCCHEILRFLRRARVWPIITIEDKSNSSQMQESRGKLTYAIRFHGPITLSGDFMATMWIRNSGCAAVFPVALLILASAAETRAGFRYDITILPSIGPGWEMRAQGINENGEITGTASKGVQRSAFAYRDGASIPLSVRAADPQAFGNGISGSGDVAGGELITGLTEPVLFGRSGTATILETRGFGGWASAANSRGLIAGSVGTDDVTSRAAMWKGGQLTVLSNVPGSTSYATAVNDLGIVAGRYTTPDGKLNSFIWESGVVSELGTASQPQVMINDINNSGDIVGAGRDINGVFRNFAIVGGSLRPLLPLPGGDQYGPDSTNGDAINDDSQIVGASINAQGRNRAALFENGQTLDLNGLIDRDFGLILNEATDINSRGQITGVGYLNGEKRAFLLTPISVPLPNSAALAATTLPMVLLARRSFRWRAMAGAK
jgi:probable HAF family extracellular repeat protein